MNWAERIADHLEHIAVQHWDYTIWPSAGVSYDLYHGCSGMAIFFAALYRQTSEMKYRTLALKAIKPLRKSYYNYYTMGQKGQKGQKGMLGITMGTPSYLYSLLVIGDLLKEELAEDIQAIYINITAEAIADAQYEDVMRGLAGTILSLLKYDERTGDKTALEKAVHAGKHLTQSKPESRTITGFSHGAAGMSYALFRLYSRTGDVHFLEAGKRLILDERMLLDERKMGAMLERNSWCHGHTGIALARLGCHKIWFDKKMLLEIEQAYEFTIKQSFSAAHSLCCGNFGRLEFIFTYAVKSGEQELIKRSEDYLQAILYETDLTYVLKNAASSNLHAGFFSGLAGIGYQFLRMLDAKSLPSILLFE